MKNILILTLLVISVSCNNNSKSNWKSNIISSLDNKVASVSSIDFMQLLDKSEILTSESMPSEIRAMLNGFIGNNLNSKQLGVKLEGNNHIVTVVNDKGSFDYTFAMFNVLDKDKIGKNIKLLIGGKSNNTDKYSCIINKDLNLVFIWDEKHLIVTFSESRYNKKSKKTAESLLMAKNEALDADEHLLEYLSRTDDMNSAVFLESYSNFVSGNAATSITELENSMLVYSANFNKGNMLFENIVLGSQIVDSKFDVFGKSAVSDEYINFLTDNNKLILYGLANFNIDKFLNIIIDNKLDREISRELRMDIKDIKDVFDGQMSFSIMDIILPEQEEKETPISDMISSAFEDDFFSDMGDINLKDIESSMYGYSKNEPLPKLLFTAGINNVDVLLQRLKKSHIDVNLNDINEIDNSMFLLVKDDKLFISTMKELLEEIKENGSLNTYKDHNKTDYPIYGTLVVDADELPSDFIDVAKEEVSKNFTSILKNFKSVEFNASANGSLLEIKLSNDKENSLKLFTEIILEELGRFGIYDFM